MFELRAGWDIQEDDEKKPCLDPPKPPASGHTLRTSPEGCDSESEGRKPDENGLTNDTNTMSTNNNTMSTDKQTCADDSTRPADTPHTDVSQPDAVADTVSC